MQGRYSEAVAAAMTKAAATTNVNEFSCGYIVAGLEVREETLRYGDSQTAEK